MISLSIITINLNNLLGLQKTIDSILSQTYPNYEIIVVDGKSTDGSVEYLESHKNFFSELIIEKDRGIYHAMNKGIRFIRGKYVLFLNSGDYFATSEVLEKLRMDKLNCDLLLGKVRIGEEIIDKTNSVSNISLFLRQFTFPHQGTLIRSNLFRAIGFYLEFFKYRADYEWFVRAIGLELKIDTVGDVISIMEENGMSIGGRASQRYKIETSMIQAFVKVR